MIIRELKSEDIDKWIELANDADNRNEKWARDKFDRYLNSQNKKRLLIVEEKGRLIGFAGVKAENLGENVSPELNEKYLVITWIAFIPEFRNKGLGSKLLNVCKKYAKKWKMKGIWTGCRDKVMPFYEKNGFKKKGTFVNEHNKKENLMVMEIK